MNDITREIKKDLNMFQGYVQKMSANIQSVSVQWNDEQYASLAQAISRIANQAKDVLVTGDKVCESLDKFDDIANEDYG